MTPCRLSGRYFIVEEQLMRAKRMPANQGERGCGERGERGEVRSSCMNVLTDDRESPLENRYIDSVGTVCLCGL